MIDTKLGLRLQGIDRQTSDADDGAGRKMIKRSEKRLEEMKRGWIKYTKKP